MPFHHQSLTSIFELSRSLRTTRQDVIDHPFITFMDRAVSVIKSQIQRNNVINTQMLNALYRSFNLNYDVDYDIHIKLTLDTGEVLFDSKTFPQISGTSHTLLEAQAFSNGYAQSRDALSRRLSMSVSDRKIAVLTIQKV